MNSLRGYYCCRNAKQRASYRPRDFYVGSREHISALGMALTGMMAGPAPDWMTSEHLTGVKHYLRITVWYIQVLLDFYYGRGI